MIQKKVETITKEILNEETGEITQVEEQKVSYIDVITTVTETEIRLDDIDSQIELLLGQIDNANQEKDSIIAIKDQKIVDLNDEIARLRIKKEELIAL